MNKENDFKDDSIIFQDKIRGGNRLKRDLRYAREIKRGGIGNIRYYSTFNKDRNKVFLNELAKGERVILDKDEINLKELSDLGLLNIGQV